MVKEGAEDAAARIMHRDRRLAERLGRPRYEVACRLLVGEIAPEGRARLACRFARRILVEIGEHDAGAVSLEAPRDRKADAASGAGDDCDPAMMVCLTHGKGSRRPCRSAGREGCPRWLAPRASLRVRSEGRRVGKEGSSTRRYRG